MHVYWDLFTSFFRIGLFTFGGGYAMLPMLQREVVEKRGWATEEELLNYFAVGQCTPGIIAVNTATFVGYKQKKTMGGVVATLGVVIPSIIIITAIAALLSNFAHIPAVQHAFSGIRIAVAALIVSAVIRLFRANVLQKSKESEPQDWKTRIRGSWLQILLCVVAFVLVAVLGVSPVFVVIGAALAGIAVWNGRAA